MMLSTIAFALQTTLPILDQTWKFDVGLTGAIDFPNPVGNIENPLVRGELSFTNEKVTKPGQDPFMLTLKARKNQSELVQMFEKGIAESPTGPKHDKDYLYVSHSYWINAKDLSVEGDESHGYDQTAQIMNPFAVGIAVMRRTLASPELKKEYYLMTDGPRKFYGVFNTNPNATTDPAKGEVAFKFNIVLKENKKEYPNFFVGAVRGNSKTGKIEYIRASSKPSDGPTDINDSAFPSVKSFAFNLTAK